MPDYSSPAEKMEVGNESHSTVFRHSGWLPLRRRVQRAMVTSGQSLDRRLRFMSCGSTYHILQSIDDPSKHRLCANACHDRFCLPCANERARLVAYNVHEALPGTNTRFITLTLKSDDEPLTELLEKLYTSFKTLRTCSIWKTTQLGGVAFLEVKWNPRTNRWHPHFHILTHGKFIDQPKLSTAWKAITKDSWVCDVRQVKEAAHAVHYCTKYASKPFDRDLLANDDRLAEAMTALQGRRMILTFGDWKGIRVTAKPDKEQWTNIGTVAELARLAVDGDKATMQILITLLGDKLIPFLMDAKARNDWTPSTSIDWAKSFFVAKPSIP
jgi:hypothetical protein